MKGNSTCYLLIFTCTSAKIILFFFLANCKAFILPFSFSIFLLGGVKSGRKYVVYQIYRLTWGFHFLTEAIHKKGNPAHTSFDKKVSPHIEGSQEKERRKFLRQAFALTLFKKCTSVKIKAVHENTYHTS